MWRLCRAVKIYLSVTSRGPARALPWQRSGGRVRWNREVGRQDDACAMAGGGFFGRAGAGATVLPCGFPRIRRGCSPRPARWGGRCGWLFAWRSQVQLHGYVARARRSFNRISGLRLQLSRVMARPQRKAKPNPCRRTRAARRSPGESDADLRPCAASGQRGAQSRA